MDFKWEKKGKSSKTGAEAVTEIHPTGTRHRGEKATVFLFCFVSCEAAARKIRKLLVLERNQCALSARTDRPRRPH